MSVVTSQDEIVYEDSDGRRIADNTLQFEWIVTLKGGLDALFHADPDVFVAGDLLWYPVKGQPKVERGHVAQRSPTTTLYATAGRATPQQHARVADTKQSRTWCSGVGRHARSAHVGVAWRPRPERGHRFVDH